MNIDLEFAKKIGATHYCEYITSFYKISSDGRLLVHDSEDGEDVSLGWTPSNYDLGCLGEYCKQIEYPQDQPKGHKHADLAIQYWTEAKKDAEAWRNWEFKDESGKHRPLTDPPCFYDNVEYRRKPKVKLVHGFEVPDISFVPTDDDVAFFTPLVHLPEMVGSFSEGANDEIRHHLSANNACYPHTEEGKQAAIKHALAMLGFGSMEEYKKTMGK